MSERSIVAYEGFREGSEKFDYFMCGLIGAVFAYIAQGYKPSLLFFGPTLLEPAAVVLLGLALFCGIKRLERVNQVMLLNHKLLDAAESAEKYASALDAGKFPIRRSDTDELQSADQCAARLRALREDQAEGKKHAQKLKRSGGYYYRFRQHFFLLGLLALVSHRLLLPYK